VQDVCAALEHIGLDSLTPSFRANAVNGQDLLALTDEDFETSLQCTKLQTRKIRRAIADVQGRTKPAPADAAASPEADVEAAPSAPLLPEAPEPPPQAPPPSTAADPPAGGGTFGIPPPLQQQPPPLAPAGYGGVPPGYPGAPPQFPPPGYGPPPPGPYGQPYGQPYSPPPPTYVPFGASYYGAPQPGPQRPGCCVQ
jgi:hypothetical protein